MAERLHKAADEAYTERVERNSPEAMRYVEKQVILQTLDHLWRDHLVTLDHLRQVIGWRGMAQRDPLNEYKSEAFDLFRQLIAQWHEAVIAQMMRIEVRFQPPEPAPPPMQFQHLDPAASNLGRPFGRYRRADRRRRPRDHRGARRGAGAVADAERDPADPAPGAGSAATRPARAARARSTSTATGCWRRPRPDRHVLTGLVPVIHVVARWTLSVRNAVRNRRHDLPLG